MSMIMDGFRKHTKTVIWVVTIAFIATIVLVWGMDITGMGSKYGGQKSEIGKVNGEKITAVNYFRALDQAINQETERAGGEHPSDETIEYLQDQTWDNLVGRILLEQEIRKRNIKVSDAEVSYYLKNNPPEWLKNQQIFQKDGKFDKSLYDQALQNPSFINSPDWLQVESAIRSSLPFEKLQREIEASVRVTDLEVREDFVNRNEKAKVKYIFINPNDFYNEKVEIKEDDMKKYYDEHQKDFNRDEQRKVKFVRLEKKPSIADTLSAKTRIEYLLERAKKGEIFDTLAVHYSEDPGSGKNGGDLGFFGKGQMVKPFEEAAFALKKPGDLSAPVLSQFGWHIIKLEEKKKEKVGDKEEEKIRAKHILLKITMSDSTLTQLDNKLNDFVAELNKANTSLPDNNDPATIQKKKNNFDDVGKKLGLAVTESDYFFKRGGYIPFLGRMTEAVDFTFKNDPGTYSDIIEDDQNICVVMVSDVKAGGIQPFNEVRTQIESILRQDKWKEKAKEKATRVVDVIVKGNLSLEQVAERDTTLKVKETNLFSRNDYVPSAGRNNAFTGSAFGLPIGATSGMLETDAGFFFLRVEERTPINESDFENQKESIKNQLLEKKKNSVFNNWFNALKENSKIEDNRNFFLNREGSEM